MPNISKQKNKTINISSTFSCSDFEGDFPGNFTLKNMQSITMIKKILSWFKFKKYIKITHRDPVSFETDQLIRKNQEPSKIVTKLKYLKK